MIITLSCKACHTPYSVMDDAPRKGELVCPACHSLLAATTGEVLKRSEGPIRLYEGGQEEEISDTADRVKETSAKMPFIINVWKFICFFLAAVSLILLIVSIFSFSSPFPETAIATIAIFLQVLLGTAVAGAIWKALEWLYRICLKVER